MHARLIRERIAGIGDDNESRRLKVISTGCPLCCAQQTFDQLVLKRLL